MQMDKQMKIFDESIIGKRDTHNHSTKKQHAHKHTHTHKTLDSFIAERWYAENK